MTKSPKISRMRVDAERGSTLPLAVAVVFVLTIMLAFAFDMGGQLVLNERNNSDLQICREELEQVADGFQIKNSEKPDETIASLAVESLRNQGFSGDILVYVEELPKGYTKGSLKLPDSDRVISVRICLIDEYDAMFARGVGIEKLEALTDLTFSICPYSESTVWRPSSGTAGVPSRTSFYSLGSAQNSKGIVAANLDAASHSKINAKAYDSDVVWKAVHDEAMSSLAKLC
jgi:hypothetical protein